MRILIFMNALSLGGTEKAACYWAGGLKRRGHDVAVVSLAPGPRQQDLESEGICFFLSPTEKTKVREVIGRWAPEIIHAHAPGTPHVGDLLGEALVGLPKIPVLQTNIFGRFENEGENRWVDFRAFISWTSCVQAARRSGQRLDGRFFERCSVVGYPLEPEEAPSLAAIHRFRKELGVSPQAVMFGRLSRPDPVKWDPQLIPVWNQVCARTAGLILLLREPPPEVAQGLLRSNMLDRYRILPVTSDPEELRITRAALDGVIHLSKIGESFGYGIAEPMNLAKPVIANLTPWQDQAQVELVRHGECGYVCGSPASLADAIERLAASKDERDRLGRAGQQHIRTLAAPAVSLNRLELLLHALIKGKTNPLAAQDLAQARAASDYLARHEFGHSFGEQWALRPQYLRTRLNEWRRRRGPVG